MLESTCFMIKGFADIVIADITAGLINHYFAEIAPLTVYPLYSTCLLIVFADSCDTKTWRKGVTKFHTSQTFDITPTLCNHQQPFALSISIKNANPFAYKH